MCIRDIVALIDEHPDVVFGCCFHSIRCTFTSLRVLKSRPSTFTPVEASMLGHAKTHQDGPGRQGVPDLAWHFLTSGTSMRG